MVVSYLALIIAVSTVSFDTGLAISLRKAGIGFLAPETLLKIYLLCLMNALENLAVGSSWKICLAHVFLFYSKLFAAKYSSFGSERHTHKPCWHSLIWSLLLISVGQLLMVEDGVSFVELKQVWGERRPAKISCEAQSTAVGCGLGIFRSFWNAPLFRVYKGRATEGINQLIVELLWQLMYTSLCVCRLCLSSC